MKRWLDAGATDWFYRSVIEADQIKQTANDYFSIIRASAYSAFETDYPRKVFPFTSNENQSAFECKGYKPHKDNVVYVYIDGVPVAPSKLETDKVTIPSPIAGGLEVIIICSGVPKKQAMGVDNCVLKPVGTGCASMFPSYQLERKADYVYDTRYSLNEKVVCMGKQLTRVKVEQQPGESLNAALTRVIETRFDVFTIIDGVLYVSSNLNDVPVKVNYNYLDPKSNVVKNRQNEPAIPHADCAVYNDRYFPNDKMMKYEFYVILDRLRENLYSRFTDKKFNHSATSVLSRTIADKSLIVGKWYEGNILNILEEKFNDGCYVFPLYDDNTFIPTECITRAEMVVALNRLLEWALEKFR